MDDTRGLVLLRDFTERPQEQPITELHDVRLMHTSDLLASILQREIEREAGDTLGLAARGDFERLDDTGERLVLEPGVLALGVLADDGKVDVVVPRGRAADGLAYDDGGIDVELLAHGDVP